MYSKVNKSKELRYYRCSGRYNPYYNCPNHRWRADTLEDSVWREVEDILTKPDMVLAGLKAVQQDEDNNTLEQELKHHYVQLKALDKDQDQLLQWALSGFPKETIEKENDKINYTRKVLKQLISEKEERIQRAKKAKVDIMNIKGACNLIKGNLSDLSFENKRKALEALSIRVWIDNLDINIEGDIPVYDGVIASCTS